MSNFAGKLLRESVIGSDSSESVLLTVAATIGSNETQVRADTTLGTMVLTMPRAELCSGKIYTIELILDNGDLVLAFPGANDPGDQTMDTVKDYVVCYSGGSRWYILTSLVL